MRKNPNVVAYFLPEFSLHVSSTSCETNCIKSLFQLRYVYLHNSILNEPRLQIMDFITCSKEIFFFRK